MSCDQAHILTLMHVDDLDVQHTKVYLQSMKTYILSVNTLTWNLTSERHDNCAPCLDLILPIRWVTPPPNSCLKCFNWRYNCKVFAFDLSSTLIWLHVYLHNVDLSSIYIQTVYSANISKITILHTTLALHAQQKRTAPSWRRALQ